MFDVYKHDEEGLQGVAIDPNFEDNHWVYAYYSPPLNTPVDDPSTPASTRATRRSPATPARLRAVQGRASGCRASSSTRNKLDMSHRAEDHRRAGRPRHLLPRRRQHRLRQPGQPVPVDRRRHEPVLLRRLRAARRPPGPQPGVRRAAQRRQHERPARQDPAHPRRSRRRLHDPVGQPVPPGHGEDASRDLRDGPAQPVPLRGQPQQRRRLPRPTTRPTRRWPNPIAAPRARAGG